MKIALIYGSMTGNTEIAAELIRSTKAEPLVT